MLPGTHFDMDFLSVTTWQEGKAFSFSTLLVSCRRKASSFKKAPDHDDLKSICGYWWWCHELRVLSAMPWHSPSCTSSLENLSALCSAPISSNADSRTFHISSQHKMFYIVNHILNLYYVKTSS